MSEIEVVVIAAWCPCCGEDTIPNARGECCWCDTRIIDGDHPPARAVLEEDA